MEDLQGIIDDIAIEYDGQPTKEEVLYFLEDRFTLEYVEDTTTLDYVSIFDLTDADVVGILKAFGY